MEGDFMDNLVIKEQLQNVQVPHKTQNIYKDECVYSFDNPEFEKGLYICMNTFVGLGRDYVADYFQKTQNGVFLHIQRFRKKKVTLSDDPPAKKPTKLAIGIEGGFDVDNDSLEVEEHLSIVVLPSWTEIVWPNSSLPEQTQKCVKAILDAESVVRKEEIAALAGMWDGEKKKVSRHANDLYQIANPPQVPPTGWQCHRCELRDNLWLNLTDGQILCGRKFWDGTGGNNHAVDHYKTTHYPLAVKLGTITAEGADVYSYDEDDMVDDPKLAEHLAHFGIDVMKMKKTEKSMVELEIDLNQRMGEWSLLQESGGKLEPAYGPGRTGIVNLGNSCYMNSVLQVIFSIPTFVHRYYRPGSLLSECSPLDAPSNFSIQMSKVAHGLLSGKYSQPPPIVIDESADGNVIPSRNIRPHMFKNLIGRGHPEFATKRQQDAQEFLLHLLNTIAKNTRANEENPIDSIRFEVEERLECMSSHKVKYTYREDNVLGLPVPLTATINAAEVAEYEEMKRLQATGQIPQSAVGDVVRPKISMLSCLNAYCADEFVEGFYSSAVGEKVIAKKSARLASFPDYLFVQVKKFTTGQDWIPKKLDIWLEVLETLDLTPFRGVGIQPNEVELPETGEISTPRTTDVQIDESLVENMIQMGFSANGCRKAVYHTKNAGIEAAMEWVMEHMGDADFDVPLSISHSTSSSSSTVEVDEMNVASLVSMGFPKEHAVKALKNTNNNLERAGDWLLSHLDELGSAMDTDEPEEKPARVAITRKKYHDGNGIYRLVAFISHMGTSTMSGHYVAHILKDSQWLIFNDENVAISEHPPKELAYLYLYERI